MSKIRFSFLAKSSKKHPDAPDILQRVTPRRVNKRLIESVALIGAQGDREFVPHDRLPEFVDCTKPNELMEYIALVPTQRILEVEIMLNVDEMFNEIFQAVSKIAP
jgi:hypothetical protein